MQGTVLDAESVEVTILLVSYLHEISLLNNGTLARMRTLRRVCQKCLT